MIKAKMIDIGSNNFNTWITCSDIFYELLPLFHKNKTNSISYIKKNHICKRYNLLFYSSVILRINNMLGINRKIIIRKGKKYKLTRFGIRLFLCFYLVGYKTEIPKEFIVYYDDINNNIDMDRTIFTLKLDKQNDKS